MTNTILLCYIKDGGVMFNTLQNAFLDFFGAAKIEDKVATAINKVAIDFFIIISP